MDIMDILVVAVLIGLIPAVIANGKGRSFGLWWIYGSLFFIVALIHSLVMKADQEALGNVRCQKCKEYVRRDATVCKYCHNDLTQVVANSDFSQRLSMPQMKVRKKEFVEAPITRRCPICSESFEVQTKICPHCQRAVPPDEEAEARYRERLQRQNDSEVWHNLL